MRIVIAAVGRLKRGPESDLAERYRERAVKSGRGIGLRSLDVINFKSAAGAAVRG
jgi:23S rRNA (pseudouridine1915-N3)-methyltransferase